ncbi:imidazoleglycerol-phosphate dehydratase HisB [Brevundimonas sp.]|uniref:imidazoleglycerol-phosphate dehydratase HisB n=1 Tax=Brevundimonas sp. TaxID=1871086 RepID=UPI00391CAAE2
MTRLTNLPAPFAPLVAGGEGLDRYPSTASGLQGRLAELYGVATDQVLVTRGLTHGLERAFRLAGRDGQGVEVPDAEPYASLRRLYPTPPVGAPTAAVIVRALGAPEAVAEMADRVAPALLVIDEGLIEYADGGSATTVIGDTANLVVLRSLSLAYGLAGARVGAAVGQSAALERLAAVVEPYALPEPSLRLALQALDPSRLLETRRRIDTVRSERARLARELGRETVVEAGVGPVLILRPADPEAALRDLRALAVPVERAGDRLRLPVSTRPEVNDRLLAAFGMATASRPARRGQAVRDTRETRIVCAVDLDTTGPVAIHTGVGFFDHMLEQVAAHGGFSLTLACMGDLHTDPHHTIEDSAIALGQALKQALGERRGIARYGFVLPMDEAEAKVSIDLSGRPYPVFDGTFETPFIGDYRTDLTAHVFRSLAEHLGAAVHIAVTGADDHHKTEAVYKAFGRALRQAIRIEGEAVPSTKGVL